MNKNYLLPGQETVQWLYGWSTPRLVLSGCCQELFCNTPEQSNLNETKTSEIHVSPDTSAIKFAVRQNQNLSLLMLSACVWVCPSAFSLVIIFFSFSCWFLLCSILETCNASCNDFLYPLNMKRLELLWQKHTIWLALTYFGALHSRTSRLSCPDLASILFQKSLF